MQNPQRIRPFSLGLGFLGLSLIMALLVPQAHSVEVADTLEWFEQATLWLGSICLAGNLFSLLLRYRDQDRSSNV